MLKLRRKALRLFAIAAAAVVLSATAVPAAAAATKPSSARAGLHCWQDRLNSANGRTVILWGCDTRAGTTYHAQVVNASPGDLVYLKVGDLTHFPEVYGVTSVPTGATSADSGTLYPDFVHYYEACERPLNGDNETCTLPDAGPHP